MADIELARANLEKLLALKTVNSEARYYAKQALSYLWPYQSQRVTCPECGRDMTPRPGAVFQCEREVCAFWRIGFAGRE